MNQVTNTIEDVAETVEFEAEKAAARQKLEGAKSHAGHIADEVKGAVRDLGDAAKIGASAFRDATVSKANSTKRIAQNQAVMHKNDLESRIREEPMKYMGISLGIGFAIGWLFRS